MIKLKKFGSIIHYVNNKIDNGKIIDEKNIILKKDLITHRYTSAGYRAIRYLLKKYFNLFLNDKIRIKKELIGLKKFILEKCFSINLR